MEALQAAIASRPSLLALLQEAAELKACSGCCLRLAAVRETAAYSSRDLPHSAAQLLSSILAQHLRGEQEDSTAEAVAAVGDEGSKRRRLDTCGDLDADAQMHAAPQQQQQQQEDQLIEGNGGAGMHTDVPHAQAQQICPLCLGLLQTVAAVPNDRGEPSSQACPFELVTTISSLKNPGRYAAAAGAAIADGSSNHGAPVVAQRSTGMPSLVAAATAIAAEFELDCFALDVSLPASLAVRQQALSWQLRQLRQQQQENGTEQSLAQDFAVAVDVQDAVKLKYSSLLAAALGKPHDPEASLRITLSLSHPNAAAECSWLTTGNSGGGRQRRGRHGRQQAQQQQQLLLLPELPTLSEAVVQRLAAMSEETFCCTCLPDAAQLVPPAVPATVQLQARRQPLHVGGSYLKLRRGIPQSPWFIDSQRKGEGSVQEAIEAAVLPPLQADSYTFISAGREDIDVRMLGGGRPFILEIQNARRGVPPPNQLQLMEALIREASSDGVAVRGLCAASAAQLAALKEGEQEKQKSYMAVCWLPRPLTDADVALLEATRELEVQQQTPVRVLHRRANLERLKVVHEMHAVRLPSYPPGYFALRLRTQAGTYVKEFVHGDLGRSRPSLGDLLGGCKAQIAALDVLEIHMEFDGKQQQQQQ